MKKLILTLFTLFTVLFASAHAVFIETALKGKKGGVHTVKVVYGEPDEHEAISHWWWYKNGDIVDLVLIKPDGSKESLTTTVKEDHLLASFVPEQDGVYHVSLRKNTDRKEGAKIQWQINAVATIQVGNSTVGNVASNIDNELLVYTASNALKNRKEIALVLYEHGKPLANSAFQVIAPSGWVRWVETDDKGTARFIPEWKGKYFVEVSKREKVDGMDFEEYSRAASMSFEVR